jgi:anaerobic selenocysteine-containing dehydrogenase
MHNVPRFVRGRHTTNRLHIHPDDAAERGLCEDDLCELRTPAGHIRVPVHLSDAMMRGTVSLPHGWGHAEAAGLRVANRTTGANYNELSPDGPEALERLSGMAQLTGFAVECVRIGPNAAHARDPLESTGVD